MTIQTHKVVSHWNYLLAIERDLDELSRYVEFDEKNFECFSIEIARILLASCAEIDVVCKQTCKVFDSQSEADNINRYRNEIKKAYPGVPRFEVVLPRFGLTLHPWDDWKEEEGVPFWWTAYNKIKHQRDTEFGEANLKNALNAVAGLFVIVLYFYKDEAVNGRLIPSPQLLRVPDRIIGGGRWQGDEMGVKYVL